MINKLIRAAAMAEHNIDELLENVDLPDVACQVLTDVVDTLRDALHSTEPETNAVKAAQVRRMKYK